FIFFHTHPTFSGASSGHFPCLSGRRRMKQADRIFRWPSVPIIIETIIIFFVVNCNLFLFSGPLRSRFHPHFCPVPAVRSSTPQILPQESLVFRHISPVTF